MDCLTLKSRPPVQEEIECWDDDLDLEGEDFHFRTASVGTTASIQAHNRESASSRRSFHSEADFNLGEDERQVSLPACDEHPNFDAIASAIKAGIPIPSNVPSSALVGGTIKRLGSRQIKKTIGDDWGEDLELTGIEGGGLKIKKQDGRGFPDSIRHVSSPSVNNAQPINSAMRLRQSPVQRTSPNLDQFRDEDEDDFFNDVPTIKIYKNKSPQKIMSFHPPATVHKKEKEDDYEQDLEFPDGQGPLKLSTRKELPKTPSTQPDEFDDWGEGSLGTRFGGTRRDGRSNRSSSISALSPSLSSTFTHESEDEGWDGLVLPEGPLRFDDILKKRLQADSPGLPADPGEQEARIVAPAEDFFADIEVGDGDVFQSGKLTLNRNVKHKALRQTSPTRRTALTLTFTNKPLNTRIPRLSGHERMPSTLEPVSESGAPLPSRNRRPPSRAGHSTQSSVSSVPPPPPLPPSTPSRRALVLKPSMKNLREPVTTSAQLLKSKRSMPILRSTQQSPSKPVPSQRPPPRFDPAPRSNIPLRPKTPIDRSGADSSLGNSRRPPVPFLPAGSSQSHQSHHISIKASRPWRRHDSESSNASTDPPRSGSRLGARSSLRSPSPPRRKDLPLTSDPLTLSATAKRTLTRPRKARNFGDGSELEIFDDLPTSASVESKYVKTPIGRGAPKSIRSKLVQTQSYSERTETPVPATPFSPPKRLDLPRFARDTNASRIAREQRTGGPLANGYTNWKAQIAAKGLSPTASRGKRRHVGVEQKKPHLIKPLGDTLQNAKNVKGMQYNPDLFRWEGNENALAPFDAPLRSSSPIQPPGQNANANKMDTPRPALITNINATQGVQVVGGMVFDPQRMCWLKLSHQPNANTSSISGRTNTIDDEEDPFADIKDLDDNSARKNSIAEAYLDVGDDSHGSESRKSGGGNALADEWMVGEEFDVGPLWVNKERKEEERWRAKVQGWIAGASGLLPDHGPSDLSGNEAWRWEIRDIVFQSA
ncbi:MAG: hypothetical protein M1829_004064 [Trizodia sp. TS-e1964]|nr:MAG: hypothetical protein M1829_004064 [Trizodia sp. TS-e1964]